MAFNAKALQVDLARGSTGPGTGTATFFRKASYVTNDTVAQVETADYFNAAAARLQKGTILEVIADLDGNPVRKVYIVTSNDGTTVVIGGGTTLAGELTGTTDGELEDVPDIALDTSNTYSDAAVNAAVNGAIAAINEQLKELQEKINAM